MFHIFLLLRKKLDNFFVFLLKFYNEVFIHDELAAVAIVGNHSMPFKGGERQGDLNFRFILLLRFSGEDCSWQMRLSFIFNNLHVSSTCLSILQIENIEIFYPKRLSYNAQQLLNWEPNKYNR